MNIPLKSLLAATTLLIATPAFAGVDAYKTSFEQGILVHGNGGAADVGTEVTGDLGSGRPPVEGVPEVGAVGGEPVDRGDELAHGMFLEEARFLIQQVGDELGDAAFPRRVLRRTRTNQQAHRHRRLFVVQHDDDLPTAWGVCAWIARSGPVNVWAVSNGARVRVTGGRIDEDGSWRGDASAPIEVDVLASAGDSTAVNDANT